MERCAVDDVVLIPPNGTIVRFLRTSHAPRRPRGRGEAEPGLVRGASRAASRSAPPNPQPRAQGPFPPPCLSWIPSAAPPWLSALLSPVPFPDLGAPRPLRGCQGAAHRSSGAVGAARRTCEEARGHREGCALQRATMSEQDALLPRHRAATSYEAAENGSGTKAAPRRGWLPTFFFNIFCVFDE